MGWPEQKECAYGFNVKGNVKGNVVKGNVVKGIV